MSKDIKFRAWDAESREMIYQYKGDNDYYFWMEDKTVYCGIPDLIKEATAFEPADVEIRRVEDIMQFTGLKDKNGKEIYEGDILMICGTYGNGFLEKGDVATVEWSNDELCYFLKRYPLDRYRLTSIKKVEVIGNIFEKS